MNANTRRLHALGQSLWLDSISRGLLRSGRLARLVAERSITGLTSNPTLFEQAIGEGSDYDESIARHVREGLAGPDLFFALAIEDLREAAALFAPVHAASGGVDGWVSLEVSPLLLHDAAGTIAAASALHAQARCDNLYIKIPGTPEGLAAIEECTFLGIPVNVTLLFSVEQYVAAAEAWRRGIDRRVAKGESPVVESVASLFVSRWDAAVHDRVPPALRNRLGIAVARSAYGAYRELRDSPRWRALAAEGAHLQRLLFASTGTKDPAAPATLYVEALAAADTVDTLPEKTLDALAAHGRAGGVDPMPADGGDGPAVLVEFRRAGIDLEALATRLQVEGGEAFATSWRALLHGLDAKVRAARAAGRLAA